MAGVRPQSRRRSRQRSSRWSRGCARAARSTSHHEPMQPGARDRPSPASGSWTSPTRTPRHSGASAPRRAAEGTDEEAAERRRRWRRPRCGRRRCRWSPSGVPRPRRRPAEALVGRSNVERSERPQRRRAARLGGGRGAAENVFVNLPAVGDRSSRPRDGARVMELLAIEDLASMTREDVGRGERRDPPAVGRRDRRVRRGTARLLEGGPIARRSGPRSPTTSRLLPGATGRPPGLAVVIVGRDAPSTVYLEQILRGCAKVGIDGGPSRNSKARRPRPRWSMRSRR